ncbi:MAG TPA: peptidoglycan recognition family protein [Candidatus Saccharimonadales bacterium]|nr:peptidoglycan recognition family protein [Candidatus Saccharimonadales bacterium]
MSERLHVPDRIRNILREPNWYDQLGRIRGGMMLGSLAAHNTTEVAHLSGGVADRAKSLLLRVFTEMLEDGAIALGQTGPNWDAERQSVDTVVVHHTGRQGSMDLAQLNALHLLNLYVPKYRNPGADIEIIGGTPVYSGHADASGRQVFYGYHWLVREDGSREHLLPDEAIGWHAGSWDVNTRSIAVCFDGNFAEGGQPSGEALESAAELIASDYSQVESARVLGHGAIVQTACPGSEFEVWGAELRALVEASRN